MQNYQYINVFIFKCKMRLENFMNIWFSNIIQLAMMTLTPTCLATGSPKSEARTTSKHSLVEY